MKTNQKKEEHLKFLTREHYNRYTFQEPSLEELKNYIKSGEQIQNVLPLEDVKEPILDAGCGVGKYTRMLEAAGFRKINGIDISPNELEIAKKYLKYAKVREGDATSLDFENNSFNTVLSLGVAHHTPNPRKAFEECARVCAPGGKIVFAVYRKNSLYYWDYLVLSGIVKLIFKLKLNKAFNPLFKLWFYFLDGDWKNSRILLSSVTDRYLSPVVEFFTFDELVDWSRKSKLEILKVGYTSRKSVIALLLKKRNI